MNDVHAFGLENGIKCLCELAVTVVNQEAIGCLAFLKLPNHLPGLLSDPTSIGIGGDACQMNLASPKFDFCLFGVKITGSYNIRLPPGSFGMIFFLFIKLISTSQEEPGVF